MKTVLFRKSIVAAALVGLSLSLASAWGAKHMMEKDAKDLPPPAAGMPGMNPAQMREMQGSMIKMHELMHQMQTAKTPAEREKLQQQHMQLMQSHMQTMMPMMMHGMGGQGGMPMGKMPPGQPK